MSASAIFAIVTGAGVLLLGGGALITRSARRWRRTAARAQGTVVRLEARVGGPQASTILYAWVRYTTADGRELEGRTTFGTNPPPARVGHPVGVLYHPDSPERVRVDTLMGRGDFWALPCYLLGGLVVLIGIIGLRAS